MKTPYTEFRQRQAENEKAYQEAVCTCGRLTISPSSKSGLSIKMDGTENAPSQVISRISPEEAIFIIDSLKRLYGL